MLPTIPGLEDYPAARYIFAVAFVFVLLALLMLGLRRLTRGRIRDPQTAGRTRQPRLGIVDMYDLDAKRQLLLLRRDNVEHLILIGGPNDVVIETNISRGSRGAQPGEVTERIDPEPREPISRPVLEGGRTESRTPPTERLPRPREESYPETAAARLEPSMETRQQRPPAAPTPPTQRPLRAAPVSAPLDRRPTAIRNAAPPPPGAAAGGDAAVLSDMAKQLEEALRRPGPQSAPPAAPPPRSEPVTARQPPRTPAPEPPRPRPAPPSAPAPANVAAAPAPANKAPPPDPFSVDEIEAEFARLLGRPTQDEKP